MRTLNSYRWNTLRPAGFRLALALLPLSVLGVLTPQTANAQAVATPALLAYQGRLSKPDGTPVANANYSIRFRFYNAATAGTVLWEQTISPVATRNGTFSALLNVGAGFQNGATAATLFNGNLWLEIKIGNDAALSPRLQLASVAYAKKADTVPDGSLTGAKIAAGTITGDKLANGTITGTKIAAGTITGSNIANGTITSDKISGGLTPSGAAGGDLIGTYPNPELRTVASSLYKVSGSLMSALLGGAAGIDLSQNFVSAQNQDEAWQSFVPSQSGNLTAVTLYIGTTTGSTKTIPLTIYSGEGTTGGVLGSTSITVTAAMGFQNFSLAQPVPVVGGQKYTIYVGRSASLQFGYSNGDPYTPGRSDLGPTLDYAFRTYMNTGANGRVAVNGDFTVTGTVTDTLRASGQIYSTKALSPAFPHPDVAPDNSKLLFYNFGNGNWSGMGVDDGGFWWLRTGYSEAGEQQLTFDPNGRLGIGVTAPEATLHLNGDQLFNNGRIIYGKNVAGANEPFLWPRWSDNASYLNYGVGGFYVRNNTSSPTMFLTNDGKVGVGTTAPGSKLTVNGDLTATGPLTLLNGTDLNLNGNGNDPGDIVFRNSAGGQLGRIWSTAGLLWLSPRGDSDVRALVRDDGLWVGGNLTLRDSGIYSILFAGNGEGGADTGIRHNADGRIGFVADGFERVLVQGGDTYLSGNRNFISGTVSIAGSQLFLPGLPEIGDYKNVQYNSTTGQLGWDNSTKRAKRDIRPLTENDDVMKLLQAEGKIYTRPWNRERWEIGFIAEDFDALGLKRLVWYEKDGKTPEGLNYEKIVVYLTEIAKNQQKQIEAGKAEVRNLRSEVKTLQEEKEGLKARMDALEAAVKQLTAQPK